MELSDKIATADQPDILAVGGPHHLFVHRRDVA
jgi:hypothetical protein